MIIGIGTDIVEFSRIENLYLRYGERFARRILSKTEMSELRTNPNPARLLMKRFAAKEALAKAAGSGLRHPVGMTQISVIHDEKGKPSFLFEQTLAIFFEQMGITRHHLSISDEHTVAVAFVIFEGGV